jgi:hypothetical protein
MTIFDTTAEVLLLAALTLVFYARTMYLLHRTRIEGHSNALLPHVLAGLFVGFAIVALVWGPYLWRFR